MFAVSYSRTEAGIRARQRPVEQSVKLEVVAPVSAPLVVETVELIQRPQFPVVKSTFQKLEATTFKLFGVTRSELYSKRRQREVTLARHFLMYWACRRTLLSLPQIGRLMGGRDHTTILHGKESYPKKRALHGRTLREAR